MTSRTRSDLLFRYLADTKSLEKGNRRARSSMGGVAETAKKLAGVFAVTFGARRIVEFGNEAITASSDYIESINAVEVATGEASAEIFKLGETSATALGISKTELNEAAVAFAGFAEQIDTRDVGGVFEDLVTRASDFASVFNLEVSEAMEVFQSALAGQSRPIRRFGKDTSDAAITAFAYANGIAEVGSALTRSQKVQATYGQLMAETDEVQGDFAATSGELAGQQRIANAQMEDGKVILGQQLQPAQEQWVKFQRNVLIPTLINTSSAMQAVEDQVGDLRKAFDDAGDTNLSYADRGLAVLRYFDNLGRILDPTQAALDDVNRRLEEQKPVVEELVPVMSDLADTSVRYRDVVLEAAGATDTLSESANTAEANLRSLDELVKIFSGNLFNLAEATNRVNVDRLFRGGGGSGEVAEPGTGQAIQDSLDNNTRINGPR